MRISPHTELKHTNTTNRIYKYKVSALQMKTRLQQTSTDTNTNIYRKQDQTGRTPMGRSPHREQQHKHTQAHIHTKSTFGFYFWNREQQQKHTQAYTRSLLLVFTFGIESNSANTNTQKHTQAYFWFLLKSNYCLNFKYIAHTLRVSIS